MQISVARVTSLNGIHVTQFLSLFSSIIRRLIRKRGFRIKLLRLSRQEVMQKIIQISLYVMSKITLLKGENSI
jgi:hypothetical protein